MAKHRLYIETRGLNRIVYRFLFGRAINVQALEAGAKRMERVSIRFDCNGDLDCQHFSQFHAAPQAR
jgi:hypothetical protein